MTIQVSLINMPDDGKASFRSVFGVFDVPILQVREVTNSTNWGKLNKYMAAIAVQYPSLKIEHKPGTIYNFIDYPGVRAVEIRHRSNFWTTITGRTDTFHLIDPQNPPKKWLFGNYGSIRRYMPVAIVIPSQFEKLPERILFFDGLSVSHQTDIIKFILDKFA